MNKSKQKNDVKPDLAFQSSTAAADFGYWLVEKACFSFLAVTTGIMSYNAFQGMIRQNVPPQFYYIAVGIVVVAIYLIIDHNMSNNFKEYWKNKSNSHDFKNARYVKKFLDITALFIIIRFGLTISASWWSAGEVGDLTTTKPDAQAYLSEVSKYDENQRKDKDQASIDLQNLRDSETDRIGKATRLGNKLVAAKVAEGSIHQRDMWKRNPTFFDALSPTSKYYKHNKAFADKVHAAQAEAKQLVQDEYNKTRQAAAFYQNLTIDSTGRSLTNSIANTITNNEELYNTKLKRRTNFVLRLDIVCALVGFIVMRMRYLRKRAGGEEDLEKTFSFIVAKAVRQQNINALEWLEDRLGIDINGDGTIGSGGSSGGGSNAHVQTNPYAQGYPNGASNQYEGRSLMGFFHNRGTEIVSPSPTAPNERESNESGSPLTWQQENQQEAFNVVQRTLNVGSDGTKLIDARYFKSWMKTAYKRSMEYKTKKSRHYQQCLYLRLREELEEIGWTINEDKERQTLEIREA